MKRKSKTSKMVPILKIMGLSGLTIIALSNPYAGPALIRVVERGLKKRQYAYPRAELTSLLWYLRKKKYVEVIAQNNSEIKVRITVKGITKIKKFDFDNLKLDRASRWDHKWRVVIFDIPEKKKAARDLMRDKLKELGFHKLQHSVWVCPWECIDEIIFLRNFLNIEPYVSILMADAIDDQGKLLRKFKL